MEEYRERWQQCLQMIREKMSDDHAFSVWYGDIVLEQYDPQAKTLLLQVPSHYVYEYIEQCGLRLMAWALKESFGEGVSLRYRIRHEAEPAQAAAATLQPGGDTGGGVPAIQMTGARERLRNGLHYYLKGGEQWLKGYDGLADWLTDNKGRGLLLLGTPGLGKTLICRRILPVFLEERGIKSAFVTAGEMNARIGDLLKQRCVIIDGLGTEDPSPKRYGTEQKPFYDLCNAAEQDGKLLIINTGLSTTPVSDQRYPDSILRRYGEAVISRLRAITKVVVLEGPDMRR